MVVIILLSVNSSNKAGSRLEAGGRRQKPVAGCVGAARGRRRVSSGKQFPTLRAGKERRARANGEVYRAVTILGALDRSHTLSRQPRSHQPTNPPARQRASEGDPRRRYTHLHIHTSAPAHLHILTPRVRSHGARCYTTRWLLAARCTLPHCTAGAHCSGGAQPCFVGRRRRRRRQP